MNDDSVSDPEQEGLLVYWVACRSCDYETAAHGRVACPDCGGKMFSYALAGTIDDDTTQAGATGGDGE